MIKLVNQKITPIGKGYYIRIRKAFIDEGFLSLEKGYEIVLEESTKTEGEINGKGNNQKN